MEEKTSEISILSKDIGCTPRSQWKKAEKDTNSPYRAGVARNISKKVTTECLEEEKKVFNEICIVSNEEIEKLKRKLH